MKEIDNGKWVKFIVRSKNLEAKQLEDYMALYQNNLQSALYFVLLTSNCNNGSVYQFIDDTEVDLRKGNLSVDARVVGLMLDGNSVYFVLIPDKVMKIKSRIKEINNEIKKIEVDV